MPIGTLISFKCKCFLCGYEDDYLTEHLFISIHNNEIVSSFDCKSCGVGQDISLKYYIRRNIEELIKEESNIEELTAEELIKAFKEIYKD